MTVRFVLRRVEVFIVLLFTYSWWKMCDSAHDLCIQRNRLNQNSLCEYSQNLVQWQKFNCQSVGRKKKIVSKWIRNPERSRCLKIHRSSLSDLKLLAKVPKNSSWGHGNLWNSGQSIKAARLKRGRWCTRGLHGVFAKPLEGSLRVIARDIRRSSWWWRWCVPSGRSSCVQAARTRKARTTSAARTIMHPRKTEH